MGGCRISWGHSCFGRPLPRYRRGSGDRHPRRSNTVRPLPARACGFDSHLRHPLFSAYRRRTGKPRSVGSGVCFASVTISLPPNCLTSRAPVQCVDRLLMHRRTAMAIRVQGRRDGCAPAARWPVWWRLWRLIDGAGALRYRRRGTVAQGDRLGRLAAGSVPLAAGSVVGAGLGIRVWGSAGSVPGSGPDGFPGR